MKFKKNQSAEEQAIVNANAKIAGSIEKMKCIKNTVTGKVQRVRKSVACDIIRDNSDWHFTTKKAYEKTLLDAITPGKAGLFNSGMPPQKQKGIRRDKTEDQVLVQAVLNPKYDNDNLDNNIKIIKSKPRKTVPVVQVLKEAVTTRGVDVPEVTVISPTLTKKVPATDINYTPSVVAIHVVPKYITIIKRIKHLIVGGKQVAPLTK
jgi:hypothetical protein